MESVLTTIRCRHDVAAMYVQYVKIALYSDVQITDRRRSQIECDTFLMMSRHGMCANWVLWNL